MDCGWDVAAWLPELRGGMRAVRAHLDAALALLAGPADQDDGALQLRRAIATWQAARLDHASVGSRL